MPYSDAVKHDEPPCKNENGCKYHLPHNHGLMCDETCSECDARCHPSCPAYSEVRRSNAAFEAFLDGAVDGQVAFVVHLDEENHSNN